ncbi:DNA-binding GntR family transcriptional regulator [Hamadaea flava]|uniref:GntR family transcriptional regulator n=1 Tax=Hamadaea flava TaxID=1742688 RepID=A0ABV8LQL4_9ACTN|nr:GntR family transcriptional regulator [Hamadaea flava]MCP2322329.1 DNA-binding GntR family transcriptional regulator [Hamadaea flava]
MNVADRLRAGILAGDFVPGQRLVEAELCHQFNSSRGTVRAALVNLTHEGLVERVANRSARVRTVNVEQAVAITEVRLAVEGLCAYRAAVNVTDTQVEELAALGRQMRDAVRSGEIMAYSNLNSTLHETVGVIAGQPVAADVLANLRARNVRHQFRLALRPGRPQVSLPEHLAIIEAICARDPEAAERAARRHVAGVIAALREQV